MFLGNMIPMEIRNNTMTVMKNSLKIDSDFALISLDTFEDYLTKVIGTNFFNSEITQPNTAQLKRDFDIIGNLRIRFQRTSLKLCNYYFDPLQKYSCDDELDKYDIPDVKDYGKLAHDRSITLTLSFLSMHARTTLRSLWSVPRRCDE